MQMSSLEHTLELVHSRRIILGQLCSAFYDSMRLIFNFRTGKRSKEGALQDGVNSVVRYIKNNFLDGPRQDSYDLVTGAWIPRKGQEQDWSDKSEGFTRFVSFLSYLDSEEVIDE